MATKHFCDICGVETLGYNVEFERPADNMKLFVLSCAFYRRDLYGSGEVLIRCPECAKREICIMAAEGVHRPRVICL